MRLDAYVDRMPLVSQLRIAITFAVVQLVLQPAHVRAAETTIPATATTPALPAWFVRPPESRTPLPAIVVLHGCEGYRKRYGVFASDFARNGFVAVAIDTLEPRGETNACHDKDGSRLEAEDARATLAWLRTQPGVDSNRLAVVGYSMGAIAALDLSDPVHARAAPPGLAAAIVYYPSCARRVASNAVVPTLILDGSADDYTPAPPCAALAASADAARKPISIVTYPGATHAFNVELPDRRALGHPLRFDAVATQQANAATLRFLRAVLHVIN